MQKDSNFSETWASIYISWSSKCNYLFSNLFLYPGLYTWHISSMQFDFRILCITTKRTVNTSYLFHLLVLKTNLTSRKEKHIMVLLNSIIYIYWYIYNPLISHTMISFYFQHFHQLILHIFWSDRSQLYIIFSWLENVKTFLLIVLMSSKIQCSKLQTKKVLMLQNSTNMKNHSKFGHCKMYCLRW